MTQEAFIKYYTERGVKEEHIHQLLKNNEVKPGEPITPIIKAKFLMEQCRLLFNDIDSNRDGAIS